MRQTTLSLLTVLQALLVFLFLSAAHAGEEITDTIVELSPDKSVIVVADKTINSIAAVFAEQKSGQRVLVSNELLEAGSLVSVTLEEEVENGFWSASEVVLYLDEAREEELSKLSSDQQATAENVANHTKKEEDHQQPENTPPEGGMYLQNGIWVN